MAVLQESGEMYLEYILTIREEKGSVRAIDIVRLSGYSKPSISRALGVLKEKGLITVDPEGKITLTEEGEKHAEKIYERHRILTEFFVRLGVDGDIASRDACKIEHVISETTFDKIKLSLGENG